MAPGWDPLGCAGELSRLPGTELKVLWAGETADLGRWHLTALNPEPGERRGVNERSLVLRAEAAGRRILLTGDVGEWAEHRMLAGLSPEELRADLLKVAHHGSRNSSGEAFLDAVRPRLALISAGRRNLYHHPSPVVLERLADRGVATLRTDRDGLVLVRFSRDGRMRLDLPGVPR
jgi:competence protein ComEC